MTEPDPQLTFLRDKRLAPHMTSAIPAWLWAADASHILWANGAGSARLGAPNAAALAARRLLPADPVAVQIATLARTLPPTGSPRLERFHGLGGGGDQVVVCLCSRILLDDGTPAVLVVATESVEPVLPLVERVQRVLWGCEAPVAAFSAGGELLYAVPAAAARLDKAASLRELHADGLMAEALGTGHARGNTSIGAAKIDRIGRGAAMILLATLGPPAATETGQPAAAPLEPTLLPAAPGNADRPIEPAVEPSPLVPSGQAPSRADPSADLRAAWLRYFAPRPAPTTSAATGHPTAPMLAIEERPGKHPPHPPDQAQAAPETPSIAPPMAVDAPVVPEAPDAQVPDTASHEVGSPAPTDIQGAMGPATAVSHEPLAPPETPDGHREAGDTPSAESTVIAAASVGQTAAGGSARPPAAPAPILAERRHPLRFVWQMDAEGGFTLGSDEFADVVGPRTASLIGRPWAEIASELSLDPERRVEQAIGSRDTWSGIIVAWPVDGTGQRVPVELSGLPVFDRDRMFLGYRGFGVCRDTARLAAALVIRHARAAMEAAKGAEPEQSQRGEIDAAADMPTEPPAPKAEPPRPDKPDVRPLLSIVPSAKNVVPFRIAGALFGERRALSPVERTAFREIAKVLGARLEEDVEAGREPTADAAAAPAGYDAAAPVEVTRAGPQQPVPSAFAPGMERVASPAPPAVREPRASQPDGEREALDRLPFALLVYRSDRLIHVNRTFLDWTGFADLNSIARSGGIERLFVEPGALAALDKVDEAVKPVVLATRDGNPLAVEGRLFPVTWDDATAFMLVMVPSSDDRLKTSELALRAAEAESRELRSILDTATDGVIVVERDGRIVSLNRSAEALFGYESHDIQGHPFIDLFAPESHRAALDYLDGLALSGVASLLNDGREVIGKVREGGLIPLFMTMGRVADGTEKFCAVFRDITQWKRAEEELLNAKRQAEKASSAKSDFLAKISHEIRTPLNAMIGFSEVMMEERFGPVGNERYREYLKDIHASGGHLISLINDLLDLSKIEAGKLDLTFTSVNLNELLQQCVALMQPQANRERIIIRTSLAPTLPPVVVDARSIRQIVLNLLSNSIKFTGAGGQVIVSTALTDRGEAVLRVRDTGIGMSEREIETALEPFKQLATSSRWGSGGTGLGLPLTKALAEANRASFAIKSAVNAGTLVEITFPATRVLAE